MKINFVPNNIYFSSQEKKEPIQRHLKKAEKIPSTYKREVLKHLPADIEGIKLKIRQNREESLFNKFINKNGKVSVEEYKFIREKMPFILDKAAEMVAKECKCACLPKDIATLAINAKSYFDNAKELKGKNYRIISIGTSPAPLAEALQNLGCNVIFVPISGINLLVSDKDINSSKNLKLALEYLRRKGVCAEENNNLKNIVMDYTFSGKTLSTICMLLVRENKLTSAEDIWALSMNDLLVSLLYDKNNKAPIETSFEEKAQLLKAYKEDLLYSFESEIANVPHFHINDRDNLKKDNSISSNRKSKAELFRAFEDYSKPLARAFSLCVIDEIINLQK